MTYATRCLAGRFLSQQQFDDAASLTKAAQTFKDVADVLFEMANLLPVYAPMIAIVEFQCDSALDATDVSVGSMGIAT